MRLINADELKADLHKWFPQYTLEGIEAKTLFAQILADIDNTPTVDTNEPTLNESIAFNNGYELGKSERPQGRMIIKQPSGWEYCSECGKVLEPQDKFCWNCGAEMQKGGAV